MSMSLVKAVTARHKREQVTEGSKLLMLVFSLADSTTHVPGASAHLAFQDGYKDFREHTGRALDACLHIHASLSEHNL